MAEHASRTAVVTGGAQGIGAGIARHLVAGGWDVVLGDVQDDTGAALAAELGAHFRHCDVRVPGDSDALVAAALEIHGALDLAVLNAGVTTGCGIGDDFDVDTYRRAVGINLDGVVFGMHAALAPMRAAGRGSIVATASMAGIVAPPFDPFYVATKHAVVGLVRSVAAEVEAEGIRVNALCPSFAETAIIEGIRPFLEETGFPILAVDEVVATFARIQEGDGTGECWFVIPGRESAPFEFRHAPGPRGADAPEGA